MIPPSVGTSSRVLRLISDGTGMWLARVPPGMSIRVNPAAPVETLSGRRPAAAPRCGRALDDTGKRKSRRGRVLEQAILQPEVETVHAQDSRGFRGLRGPDP